MAARKKPKIRVRKPPSEDAIRAFEEGAPTPKKPQKAATKPKARKRTSRRLDVQTSGAKAKKEQDRRQVTIYLTPEIFKEMKLRAVQEECEQSEIAEQALRSYLS